MQLPHQLQDLRDVFFFFVFMKNAGEYMPSNNRDINAIKVQLCETSMELDELGKYCRINCIVIHGVPETPNENRGCHSQGLQRKPLAEGYQPGYN